MELRETKLVLRLTGWDKVMFELLEREGGVAVGAYLFLFGKHVEHGLGQHPITVVCSGKFTTVQFGHAAGRNSTAALITYQEMWLKSM